MLTVLKVQLHVPEFLGLLRFYHLLSLILPNGGFGGGMQGPAPPLNRLACPLNQQGYSFEDSGFCAEL